jgi:mannosyltransferase
VRNADSFSDTAVLDLPIVAPRPGPTRAVPAADTPSADTLADRRPVAALLALVPAAVTGVVTGVGLDHRQLWHDEYATWQAATIPFPAFESLIHRMDLVLAPYYLLMRLWILVFGDSVVSLRMPSVIAMAMTAGLVTLLGRRLSGLPAGVVAGLLFAVLPAVTRYGQEARPYAIAMMLAAASTLLLLRALDRPTWPRWLLYGVSVVLLGCAHIVAVSILAGHFIAVLSAARRTRRLLPWRWLVPLVMVVSTIGPLALEASKQDAVIQWIRADRSAVMLLPADLAGSVGLAGLVAMAAMVGLYALLQSGAREHAGLLIAWAVVPPIATLVTFPLFHLFLYRYLLFTVPAWVLLAGIGLISLGRAASTRARPATALVLAAVVLAGAAWLSTPDQSNVRRDPLPGSPDLRAAAAMISSGARPGDGVAYGGTMDQVRAGMEYELRHTHGLRDVFNPTGAYRGGCADPQACVGQTTRIWLVNIDRDDLFGQLPPAMADVLRSRFTIDHHDSLNGVDVALLVALPPTH